MLKPTAYINFLLTKDQESEGEASLLKRSFTYVAPTSVSFCENLPGLENRIEMTVKFPGHPYWHSGELGEDETWNSIVLPWIINKTNKLQNTLEALNSPDTRSYEQTIPFGFLDLAVDSCSISIPIDNNRLPDLRNLLNQFREHHSSQQSGSIHHGNEC